MSWVDAMVGRFYFADAREQHEQLLMAGAFEEGRLRGALEEISDSPAWHEHAGHMRAVADDALDAPTLEEGER